MLVGDSGVGKSCLLEKLLDMSSTNNFISTIGVDVKNHAIKAEDGRLVRLQVTLMGEITNIFHQISIKRGRNFRLAPPA